VSVLPSEARGRAAICVALILATCAVSCAAVFIRLADAPPLAIATHRMLLTLPLVVPWVLWSARGELRRTTRRELLPAVGGGLMLALHFAAWVTSLNYTSVASSVILVTSEPFFVMLASLFLFGERVRGRGVAGALLGTAGALIIGLKDLDISGGHFYGDVLALLGAFFVAGYFLFGRGLRGRMSLPLYTLLVFGSCSLGLLAMCFLTGTPLYPYAPREWLLFAALALVPTMMGHVVLNWALRYVSATAVTISLLGEPVGATALAALILGELPAWYQLLGGMAVFGGLYLFMFHGVVDTRQGGESRGQTSQADQLVL